MASADVSYPKIPEANWWSLRGLFKKKVPAAVTASYLATALSMAESSAKSNLIGPFKKIGIIEDDGKPTDLAYDWRDDNKYPEVCKTLIKDNYPQEIQDLFHSPDADFEQVTNWFMNSARCGEGAAKMFARFYMLLLKADPKGGENGVTKKSDFSPTKNTNKAKTPKPTKKESTAIELEPNETQQARNEDNTSSRLLNKSPELHINIQLHISPESSLEQIDKIFESMAKHLKEFNK